jgi:hypothetical protein
MVSIGVIGSRNIGKTVGEAWRRAGDLTRRCDPSSDVGQRLGERISAKSKWSSSST